jgi:hypothetical protein
VGDEKISRNRENVGRRWENGMTEGQRCDFTRTVTKQFGRESDGSTIRSACGNPHRFGHGVSGNLSGKSKYRTQFEDAFNEALITQGGPEEAAQLLWEAARAKEPWAIQNICQRFSPQTATLKLTHEVTSDGIDYTRLTDEQLDQLDSLLEQASDQPSSPEGGDGPPPVP